MPVDVTPIPCYLDDYPGEIFLVEFTPDTFLTVAFLDETGAIHWDREIGDFSVTPRNGKAPTQTYSTYVYQGDEDEVPILTEFVSSHLVHKPVMIETYDVPAKYLKTFTIATRELVEYVHLLSTDQGLALCLDINVLFGVEPKTAKEPPPQVQREPIRTAGVAGGRVLDVLGISGPDIF